MKPRNSLRFKSTAFSQVLVPVFLVVILLGLLVIMVLIGLALLGLTPGA